MWQIRYLIYQERQTVLLLIWPNKMDGNNDTDFSNAKYAFIIKIKMLSIDYLF